MAAVVGDAVVGFEVSVAAVVRAAVSLIAGWDLLRWGL